MLLLDSSGFDAMLRLDASRVNQLMDETPEFLPPELRTGMTRVIDDSMGYAGMRRAMAEDVSSRLDAATVDTQLRWWSSSSGRAVSAAQVAAFRELTSAEETSLAGVERGRDRDQNAVAQSVTVESPFAGLLPKLVIASRGRDDCLRMFLGLRRICEERGDSVGLSSRLSPDLTRAVVLRQYSRLSDADLAAFRAYLKLPGAREATATLSEAYLRIRAARHVEARRGIDDQLARFARDRIGGDVDSDAVLLKVTALVDEGRSLDEAKFMLHLLRTLRPRDPRVFVELTRVALKQGRWIAVHTPGRPPQLDPATLEDAQSWMDRAIALKSDRADTLVLAGHLAYLKSEFAKSLTLLEQAQRIGTANPWLRLNMADTLWALAQGSNPDRTLLRRAEKELSTALQEGLPKSMRSQAGHALAHILADLRDIDKARAQFQSLIAESVGYEKLTAREEYAHFLFFIAGDLDAAIATARQARGTSGVSSDYSIFSLALLVKAHELYLLGHSPDATKLVKEAQLASPGIERNYARLARLPRTLPAVFALHAAGLVRDLSGAEGGLALIYASAHANSADVERLIRARANPNYLHPQEGTPLYGAILGRNTAALRVLIAHGADVSARDHEGRLPLEYAEMVVRRYDAKELEIIDALKSAAKGKSAAVPLGGPLKAGYVYQTLKRISADRFGHELPAGKQVVFSGFCQYTDENLACLKFRGTTAPNELIDVPLEKVQLVSWQDWFKEIGPAPSLRK
jgi:hypothetical protein